MTWGWPTVIWWNSGTVVPVKGPFALHEVASPWPRSAEMSCFLESPEAEQELGPSCEVVIKSSLEPWEGGCEDCCSAG